MQKKQIKYIYAFVLTAAIFIIQEIFSESSVLIARLFDYSAIDKDDLFMWISVHHILQALFALMIIFILHKAKGISGFKLKPKLDKAGIKYTIIFCIAILIYFIAAYIVGSIFNSIGVYNYELSTANVVGTLSFQLLLSGTSEEILFRSLPITLYKTVLDGEKKYDNILTVILTSFLFALAHFNWQQPIYVQWFQLVYAFTLGLAYGFVFIKSKSVIYPMIMHGMSNFISVGGCYLYMSLCM